VITPSEFLKMTHGEAPIRLRMATIDPGYTSGNPRVIFDGESALTTATYPFLGSGVGAGWRVVLAPVGTGWVILGAVGEGASGGGGNTFTGDTFFVDGQIESQRDLGTESTLVTRVGAESTARFQLRADGAMWWGPGNATRDTVLYRSTVDELRTDSTFVVGNDLRIGGDLTIGGNVVTDGWTSYSPTFSASGGGAAVGNGTITAKYNDFGKQRTLHIRMVMGSTTTYGTGQFLFTAPPGSPANARSVGVAYFQATAHPDNPDDPNNATRNADYTGACLFSGSFIACKSNGATSNIDHSIPFTWMTGDEIALQITYEIA
jgi:hypothetical protein